MNYRNLLIILTLISATIVSFFGGGYHKLMPVMFISGLFLIAVICLLASLYMETRRLIILTVVTIAIAVVDEYVHTSSGAFSYFDGMTPSPLTVFGWSLLVLGIIAISQFLYQRVSCRVSNNSVYSVLLVLITCFFLIISAWAEGYLRFLDSFLALVYFFLFMASLYYTRLHRTDWCLWVVLSSLVLGAIMEYIGGVEGLWIYQFNEPMAVFIVFTWILRILTILAISSLLGVEIQNTRISGR